MTRVALTLIAILAWTGATSLISACGNDAPAKTPTKGKSAVNETAKTEAEEPTKTPSPKQQRLKPEERKSLKQKYEKAVKMAITDQNAIEVAQQLEREIDSDMK